MAWNKVLLELVVAVASAHAIAFPLSQWKCSGDCTLLPPGECPAGAGDPAQCWRIRALPNSTALVESPEFAAQPLSTWVMTATVRCNYGSAYWRIDDVSLGIDGARSRPLSGGWKEQTLVARALSGTKTLTMALGIWQNLAECYLYRATINHAEVTPFTYGAYGQLGSTESIDTDGTYSSHYGGMTYMADYHRQITFFDASWNSNCFRHYNGVSVVTYHAIGVPFLSAPEVVITVSYYTKGTLVVEASRDGVTWDWVGNISALSTTQMTLPSPKHTRVRMTGRGPASGTAVYVSWFEFRAKLQQAFSIT
eukprot:m51a1_g3855 hypothetical protein (309) ;mRNA; r:395220-396706